VVFLPFFIVLIVLLNFLVVSGAHKSTRVASKSDIFIIIFFRASITKDHVFAVPLNPETKVIYVYIKWLGIFLKGINPAIKNFLIFEDDILVVLDTQPYLAVPTTDD
jgi:hypothetical protein